MRRWQRAGRWAMPLGSLWLLTTGAFAQDVHFTDITDAAGIDFRHQSSATSNKYLIETMGGGVALFDYDNDGRLDIFFTNGARLEDPMPPGRQPDKSDPRFWNRLYRQNEDGTFTEVTAQAGLTGMPQNRYGMGIAVGDYDNDGFQDLYVTNYGDNTLYHNNGDGTFSDVTATAGVKGGGWSESAGFFDMDNDGHLDLFVTRYMVWSFEINGYCGERKPGHRAYCHPDVYDPIANLLYRNNGDGTFTDVSVKAGIVDAGKGLGVSFADYNKDGFVDVYVANDAVQCFLYENNGDGTFTELGLVLGVGFNEDGQAFSGMGVDFADYDNDGRPDIMVTDLGNQRYRLFRQGPDGTFQDVTHASGVGAATLLFSGWSLRFFDYDNDGWKDVFVAQSHVMDNIEKVSPNLKYELPPLLLRNDSGRFVKVAPGEVFETNRVGRGAAFGDLDRDGDIDVVVNNLDRRALVLRNDGGNRAGWLGIRTVGTRSNRDGLGCRVKVVTDSGQAQYYTVNTAVGYISASDKQLLVGLGESASARLVEIRWPSGVVQTLNDVASGQTIVVTEPAR